jgi:CDP-glycerol glycerophosphotransferase (TagB/SpsB family)
MRALKSAFNLGVSACTVFLLFPVYFLSFLIVRKERRVAFGCHLSRPAGNILYFFKHCVEAHSGSYEFKWVACNKETYDFMSMSGYPVVMKNSLAGFWWCLSSKFYCYSSYVSDISYFLAGGVRGVNVWHGTPLKKIEFDIDTGIYSLRYKYKWIFKVIQPWIYFRPYKVFVSSKYEVDCFSTAFRINHKDMFETYPPRLVGFERVKSLDGYKHILIAPTFRDGAALQYDSLVNFKMLDEFGRNNKVIFHVKAHPSDVSLVSLDVSSYSNIQKVDRLVDIYSIVKGMDAVITDYSSIFFDCSYVGIPFFLHCPDVDFYNSNCRGFYFDAKRDFSMVYSESMKCLFDNLNCWLGGGGEDMVNDRFNCYGVMKDYPLSVFERDCV